MKEILFKGCGTAIATPFTKDGINYVEYKKLVDNQISAGIDAIIVCGTTGESATMSLTEKKSLIKYTVNLVNNRVPVIAGTGSNNTKQTIELSKYACDIGVNGLLIVTPYYNKTTQEGLIAHYSKISNNVNCPIILYNVPSRTGLNITPETCLKLSKLPNIVAIKEASGNISQVAQIAHLCKDNLHIYSGNDDQIIPVLSLGGIGVISVLSNIEPTFTHELVHNYLNNNIEKALQMQLTALPLIQSLFNEVNPIPIKEALNIYEYNFGIPRLPLIQLSNKNKENLIKQIQTFKKLKNQK